MMREIIERKIAELAQGLIRIPSSNPPGDEDRIAQFAADWLRGAGLDPQLIPLEPGRSSVVARVPGRERGCIVLCGHLDTVGTDPEAWGVPPLAGRIEDGRLLGLGAADMKGSVAVLMHVAARLVKRGTVPPQDVVLALTADEEFGYRGAATIAESGLTDDAELLVVAEPSSGHVYTGQKGELWIEVGFSGREAHGSTPELGINTILPAARFCSRLQKEMSTFPEVPGVGRTTLNIGRFQGGRQVNIVPDRSRVQLDVRVVRHEDHDAVFDLIDRIGAEEAEASGSQFERCVLSYHPPIVGDPIGPHVSRMLRAVTEITGREPPTGISPFSTDAVSIVPRLDVPVLIYGPGDIACAHQPDEFVDLCKLLEAYEVLCCFVASEE
jgi:succinyl-diaminopimelate desuccinylase